jgi:hypothetical protein
MVGGPNRHRPQRRCHVDTISTFYVSSSAVKLESDIGGSVAAQFHANTSGEVFVYDCRGKLRFHGGITSARGHEGDNLGESAVINIALGGESNVERSPVFGCPFRAEAPSSRN